MLVGDWDLAEKVLVVAEVGNNHEGSYALAEELVGLAARAGAGAVKFQTIVPERLVSPLLAERVAQLKRFQLSFGDFERLAKVAAAEGVMFLSTPFDLESVARLDPLVPAFKVASGDNNFWPLLEAVAATAKPLLLSTGLADLEGLAKAKSFIEGAWAARGVAGQLALLHCVTCYPVPPADANLRAMAELGKLGVTVGYSDHTLGVEAAVLSVALGARIVEKHFTIDHHHSSFRDHQLSADPDQMAELVRRVAQAEELLGTGGKAVGRCEEAGAQGARRSLVAAADLPAGARLAWEHLDWLRPGGGLAPGEEGPLLGRALARALRRGEMILPADLVQD
jgi:sialic acid synthase SpsE